MSKHESQSILQFEHLKKVAKGLGLDLRAFDNGRFNLQRKRDPSDPLRDRIQCFYGSHSLDMIQGWMEGVLWSQKDAEEKKKKQQAKARKKASKKKTKKKRATKKLVIRKQPHEEWVERNRKYEKKKKKAKRKK